MAASRNYINNKDFYAAMVVYKAALTKAVDEGKEPPRIPNYIGECFLKICSKLATKPNFSGYTYKDEMISDGIENCVMVVNSFNPDKSTNPFAYFTQIVWNSFIRRIAKEKKQQYIKHKNFQNTLMFGSDEVIHIEYNEHSIGVIQSFEDKVAKTEKKIKSKAKTGIEKFEEESDEV